MSDELKPCPFCGGEAEITRAGSVKCKTRLCYAYDRLYGTPDLSVAAWNTRASAEATARADELQKRLDNALRLVARWKSNKHPQNKDWDDGWDKAELNCSFELQQALEEKS